LRRTSATRKEATTKAIRRSAFALVGIIAVAAPLAAFLGTSGY
jgi:hypothetical protein